MLLRSKVPLFVRCKLPLFVRSKLPQLVRSKVPLFVRCKLPLFPLTKGRGNPMINPVFKRNEAGGKALPAVSGEEESGRS